jgi:riboflavin kinase/FMN adenylyltransferase
VVLQKDSAVPAVVTFKQGNYKNTASGGQEHQGDILSFRQKVKIFENLGISLIIVIEFSEAIRLMKGAEFLRVLYEQGKMCYMAVGSDFRCGNQLDTDVSVIQNFNNQRNIQTCIVQAITKDSKPISSRLIRSFINQGNLHDAAEMLGRPFTIDLYGDTDFSSDIPARKNTGRDIKFDIAGQGRILPPPGKYPVLLLDKNCDQNNGISTEILVEGGNIIIGADIWDSSCEYVEFLSPARC